MTHTPEERSVQIGNYVLKLLLLQSKWQWKWIGTEFERGRA